MFFAILSQPYVKTGERVDLANVKEFLAYNGFQNIKRNDYRNEELDLILEDMHDENILIISDVLFFIDTVFYIDGGDKKG